MRVCCVTILSLWITIGVWPVQAQTTEVAKEEGELDRVLFYPLPTQPLPVPDYITYQRVTSPPRD